MALDRDLELPTDEEDYAKGQEYSDSLMFGPHPPLSDPIWKKIKNFDDGDQLLAANFLHGRVTSVTPFLMKERYKANGGNIWDMNRKPENAFRLRKLSDAEVDALFNFSSIEQLDKHPDVWKKTPQEIQASHTAYQILDIQFPWENPSGYRYTEPYLTSTYNGYNIAKRMGLKGEFMGWSKEEDATHNYYINPGKRYRLCSDEESALKHELQAISAEKHRLHNLINKRAKRKEAPSNDKLEKRIADLQKEYDIKKMFHGVELR